MFINLYSQTFWPKWLYFFQSFQKRFGLWLKNDRKKTGSIHNKTAVSTVREVHALLRKTNLHFYSWNGRSKSSLQFKRNIAHIQLHEDSTLLWSISSFGDEIIAQVTRCKHKYKIHTKNAHKCIQTLHKTTDTTPTQSLGWCTRCQCFSCICFSLHESVLMARLSRAL